MSRQISQKELHLLTNDPESLILEVQDLIDIVINKFIKSGKFYFDEKEDIKQTVNEELLKKIPRIKQQFKGNSLLRTYLATVINNICFEILRRRKRDIKTIENIDTLSIGQSDITPEAAVIIEQELLKLDKIFQLFYRKQEKLKLCLRLRFRIPFTYADFEKYSHKISEKEYRDFETKITPYLEVSDLDIYHSIIPLFNECEGKKNTADSLRKWIKFKINELINLLNGVPPTSNYNEESLQILFEKYIDSDNIL